MIGAFRAILWETMMLFLLFMRSRDRIDRNERGVLDAIVDAGVFLFVR